MIEPEQHLFQKLLEVIISDAVCEANNADARREKARSDAMIRRNTTWFQKICMFAGFDPEAIRGKYLSGKINAAEFSRVDDIALRKAANCAMHKVAVLAVLGGRQATAAEVGNIVGIPAPVARAALTLLRNEGRGVSKMGREKRLVWRASHG